MKVVIVNDDFPPSSFGGAGMIAFRQAIAFQNQGHQVWILTSTSNKNEVGQRTYAGLTIYSLFSQYAPRWQAYRSLYNSQTVPHVRSFLNTIQPQIVHFHNIHYHLSYHSLKLASQQLAKVFLTLHDVMAFSYGKLDTLARFQDPTIPQKFSYTLSWKTNLRKARWQYNPCRNYCIRRYLRYVDQILPVSVALKEALEANHVSTHQVVHNGIDTAPFEAVTETQIGAFKKQFRLEGKKVLFMGGRFGVAKGGNILKEVLPTVVNQYPEVVLVVAAKNEGYTKSFWESFQKQGLEKHVVITGWLEPHQMPVAYCASDLCLTLSICFDSFPNANLEAYAAKKPVIGTCFGGTSEVVLDQETGYIVNPVNIADVVQKTLYLLRHPEIAQKFGEQGYQRVRSEFTLQKQYETFLSLYQRELGKI